MFSVSTFNNIASRGLDLFPDHRYRVDNETSAPDAVLLRSFNLHDWPIPDSLKAVARAGAGVNNVPVDAMSARGIPVFNAPGANANAVKELVLAGMLMVSRNLGLAVEFVRGIDGDEQAFHQQVEQAKKQFVGYELHGLTLGVVGLGAIGVQVANMAADLGMNVLGYDPELTVASALRLSSRITQEPSMDHLVAKADFLTFHIPLNDATRHMLNAKRILQLPPGAVVLNFSRQGIVDEKALLHALDQDRVHGYVTDFPSPWLNDHKRIIALPHLGASTRQAEENCAMMVVRQLIDFLEYGNVTNSVNFPEAVMPRAEEGFRLAIANANVPNMVGQISGVLADTGLNIIDMLNKSRGQLAYTLIDVAGETDHRIVDRILDIQGVLSVRLI